MQLHVEFSYVIGKCMYTLGGDYSALQTCQSSLVFQVYTICPMEKLASTVSGILFHCSVVYILRQVRQFSP